MGETTEISWADHTWNAWWGCTFVGGSPACAPADGENGAECYAKTWSERLGFKIWGADAPRRYFDPPHWNDLINWNRKAEAAKTRRRVFCMSMGDWAEGRPDQAEHLYRTWEYFDKTPWLDKLMLTKRPQLIPSLMPYRFRPRADIWQGITTETQKWLDIRWDLLKRVSASIYWLSVEPLFEKIVLPKDFLALGRRAWVVVGGQSGHHAVPMHPDWVRALRDQCVDAGVAFHLKQWGEWAPKANFASFPEWDQARSHALVSPDGKYSSVRGRDTPDPEFGLTTADLDGNDNAAAVALVGKKAAGHLLDGQEWRQFPCLS